MIHWLMDDTRWQSHENFIKKGEIALNYVFADFGVFELSILLTNDKTIQNLNRHHRGKDKPTNVLSFPMLDDVTKDLSPAPTLLGDIALAYETIEKESKNVKPFVDHALHLLVHGGLHLLGYTHDDDENAEIMETKEATILNHVDSLKIAV